MNSLSISVVQVQHLFNLSLENKKKKLKTLLINENLNQILKISMARASSFYKNWAALKSDKVSARITKVSQPLLKLL
jgi:hypothetical protein